MGSSLHIFPAFRAEFSSPSQMVESDKTIQSPSKVRRKKYFQKYTVATGTSRQFSAFDLATRIVYVYYAYTIFWCHFLLNRY